MPKYKTVSVEVLPGLGLPVCILEVKESVTTAFIAPGSSGGAVVDRQGKLVGVVSAGGEGYGMLVPLKDIKEFLSKR